MKVDLQNIPLSIFQLILKTLYTGCELLTKDNVLEVWSAVHQLQIQFLIQHCEDYISENISTDSLVNYKKQADSLQSKKVSEIIFNYMLKNFMSFRKTEAFLRLDYEDVLKLVQSDSLVVTFEDLVLHSVWEWIKFEDVSIAAAQSDNESTLTTSSRDTSLTEVIEHATNIKDFSKDIADINVLVGDTKEIKETAEESQSNDVPKGSLTQTSAIPSLSQKDGAPSASNQCQENQRSVHLLPLLKATRYFLLSEPCVANLYQTELIQNNVNSIKFLFEILAYKPRVNINSYLPSAAIHRECSQLENMGVVCYDVNELAAYSFAKDKLFRFPKSTELTVFKLTVLNNHIFGCVNYGSGSKVFSLQNQKWVQILKLQKEIKIFLAHESNIYIIASKKSTVYRYTPSLTNYKIDIDIGAVDFALSFYQKIILFKTIDLTTSVRSWDTDKNTLSDLGDLDLSATNMTSFCDDRATYILDGVGRLYEVKQFETIQFIFIDRLWSLRAHELKGAALYGKALFVCGKFSEKGDHKEKVPEVFSSLRLLETLNAEFTSNFIPCAILKSDLNAE
nr:kelch-like protein 8 [Biomphalaria glabrata]